MLDPNTHRLDWLLDDLVDRLPGVEQVVVLSADGLLMARSKSVSRDNAEHLAAIAAGMHSLARGAGNQFGKGTARQTLAELDTAFLIVTSTGSGACLALLAEEDADMAMVAFEVNVLVEQVGVALSAEPRQRAGDPWFGAPR
ncbi:roadblock/LC7 domain-containing protein [Actinophytocola oryzae]|uniref:Putative regulator of Ras-like GTPase activity (Roadblock/LC7/MglB family) n=1 Tax=Actinophytocola oryzae TaxID=502181 RepID=A0A4R7W0D3_9PSEU|nr:roadblock/LC7 domain-containing protein [Actinophytocola oryzae]TDV55960.1 putative regulator of Ras-like GTPase activity (Roadblock/LC7/MglB family) [Actinophytocola oryzae]